MKIKNGLKYVVVRLDKDLQAPTHYWAGWYWITSMLHFFHGRRVTGFRSVAEARESMAAVHPVLGPAKAYPRTFVVKHCCKAHTRWPVKVKMNYTA